VYWGSLVTGVLYVTVGGNGYRAAVVKHVAAARQVYFHVIIRTTLSY
jgi:hypothetical protein